MVSNFRPILSEEQMAAYLDGMLTAEECNIIEEMIDSDPDMLEIQSVIDSIDSSFIYETDYETPLECFADDFSLPNVRYEENDLMDNKADVFTDDDNYNQDYEHMGYPQDYIEYDNEVSDSTLEDSSFDDVYDDISI